MKQTLTILALSASLVLSGCVATSTHTSPKERIDAKLGKFNSAIQVVDVRYVTQQQSFKQGKMYVQIQLHAKNGNVYETMIEQSLMPPQKARQLQRLKQATLRAISAIDGKPGHFYFYTWENLKY